MVKDDLKEVQSEPVRTEGNINDLFLLPQERPGTLVKNTVGTPFGKSVSVEGDLNQASFVPERKAGTVLNKMFGVSLKPDRKLANLNKDCKSGCTFQCEGEKCYTNGDVGAEPVLNEKYKNEVIFNTMLQANFLLEDKIDGQDQVLSSVNVDDWMTIRKKITDKNTYSGDKVNTDVQFPLTGLDMSSYVSDDAPSSSSNGSGSSSSTVYDLVGVSHHSGNLTGGHYTAYVNTNNNSTTNNGSRGQPTWRHFNDASVSPAQDTDLKGPSAYMLFYSKRS